MKENLQSLHDEIAGILEKEIGAAGYDFACGKFEGLGWIDFHYKCSTHDGPFPRIALKIQKNAVHLYLMLWLEGQPPPLQRYVGLFGKSAIGAGCLRVKWLDDDRREAIAEIARLALRESGRQKSGR
ncbi:MAG: hypothetical protein FWE09_00970 [Treponema sp.]|nr:hypothetical protein [Treponema sp.]